MRKWSRQVGVTLIELLVTVAVAAVLMVIAVPSFKNVMLSNRLDTAANGVVGAIQVARMEAVKRNAEAQFCSNSASANSGDTLGAACGSELGAVSAMSGGAASLVQAGVPGLVAPLQVVGSAAALRFNAQGLARKVGTTGLYASTVVDICTSQSSVNNHRRITMTAGSILATTPSSGACP